MWQRPGSIGHTRSCLTCSDSVQGTNEFHRICRILSYCLPYMSTLQFRNLLLYKLFCCCPSWATKIPVFSCLFPEVDTKHIITSLDIEIYTWTDRSWIREMARCWRNGNCRLNLQRKKWRQKLRFSQWTVHRQMEYCNCEGHLVNNLNFITLSSPVECETKKSLCHALLID